MRSQRVRQDLATEQQQQSALVISWDLFTPKILWLHGTNLKWLLPSSAISGGPRKDGDCGRPSIAATWSPASLHGRGRMVQHAGALGYTDNAEGKRRLCHCVKIHSGFPLHHFILSLGSEPSLCYGSHYLRNTGVDWWSLMLLWHLDSCHWVTSLVPAHQHPQPLPLHQDAVVKLGTQDLSAFSFIRLGVVDCLKIFAVHYFLKCLLSLVLLKFHFKHAFPKLN